MFVVVEIIICIYLFVCEKQTRNMAYLMTSLMLKTFSFFQKCKRYICIFKKSLNKVYKFSSYFQLNIFNIGISSNWKYTSHCWRLEQFLYFDLMAAVVENLSSHRYVVRNGSKTFSFSFDWIGLSLSSGQNWVGHLSETFSHRIMDFSTNFNFSNYS